MLDAAERLFAEHGRDATSLEEIGREAGLSRGAAAYFFGSKDGIYQAVLERLLTRAAHALAPAYAAAGDASTPVEDVVATVIHAHVALLASEPRLVRLIQWESLNGHGKLAVLLGARLHALPGLVDELGRRAGGGPLDGERAASLVIRVAALVWFPFAYESLLGSAIRAQVLSPSALVGYELIIVEHVLAELRGHAAVPGSL